MSERECGTPICGRPVHDNATICGHCVAALTQALAETPWLAGELETVTARQARYGSSRGGKPTRGDERPLPYHLPAAEAAANLKAILVSWTRMLLDEGQTGTPADTLPAVSSWLLARVPVLRLHDAGPDAVVEVCEVFATALYAIDRPADRLYLGTCGSTPAERASEGHQSDADAAGVGQEGVVCSEALWGRQGSATATCKACGLTWLTELRRESLAKVMYETLAERLVTASEAAAAISATRISHEVDTVRLTDRIRKWAGRRDGKLPHLLTRGYALLSTGGPERALFRYGDVVELYDRGVERSGRASA